MPDPEQPRWGPQDVPTPVEPTKRPLTTAPVVLLCQRCQQPLTRVDGEEQSERTPRLDFYQCQAAGCTRERLCVLFEISGAHEPADEGVVTREIARRGAFFPADLQGGRMRGMRDW